MGSEFQKSKSGFGINTSNIPRVPIFSQNGQLLIFWSKFGEIAQLRVIFWLKYCWGCCRELGGGLNKLGGGGWSWVDVEMTRVEVDGPGWRRVHVLVIPTTHFIFYFPCIKHYLRKTFNLICNRTYFFFSKTFINLKMKFRNIK